MQTKAIFRGKATDGEWVYGAPIECEGVAMIVNWMPHNPKMYWTVDGASIGQNTGMQDENGREIYEGDILCTPDSKHLMEVDWIPECAAFKCKCTNGHHYFMHELPIRHMEVIGNTYDDTYLMQKWNSK